MKRKMLVLLLFLVFFSSVNGKEIVFSFANFNVSGTKLDWRAAVFENQIEPIIDTFGFNVDKSKIEECTRDEESTSCSNNIGAAMNLALPLKDLIKSDYSIIRDNVKLNKKSDAIRVGDTIRFKPKKPEEPKIPNERIDWISQGGNWGSPPVELLSYSEYEKIKKTLQKKYDSKYPCNGNSVIERCSLPVSMFNTQQVQFSGNKQKYIGPMNKPVYVMPSKTNRKLGLQVFCTTRLRTSTGLCEPNEFDGIDCSSSTVRKFTVGIVNEGFCTIYVDKVIENGEAMEAGWFYEAYLGTAINNKDFQALSPDQRQPVAEFYCEVMEENGKKFIECDASDSIDPDGTIESYEWRWHGTVEAENYRGFTATSKKQKIKTTSFPGKLKQFTATLKVTDNDGIYNKKTKTISTNPKPLLKLKANYNYETKKAEITPTCAKEGEVTIDIDQFNTQAEPILSIIEKQKIPCNQTTSIGPITPEQTPATYQATATLGKQTQTATFTIEK